MLPVIVISQRRKWIGFCAALALSATLIPASRAVAQQPKAEPTKSPAAFKRAVSQSTDLGIDQKVNQAQEEIELAELQLATRRAQLRLAEARLAESKQWQARFEKLLKSGYATEERVIAARDDVLLHETHVATEKAGVQEAELRVKQLKRRLAYGEFPTTPQESRLNEIEQRLASLEKGIDVLQQELGNLKRMIRPQVKAPD
jgi:hypothetical protein